MNKDKPIPFNYMHHAYNTQSKIFYIDGLLMRMPDPEYNLNQLMMWQYLLQVRHQLIMSEIVHMLQDNRDEINKAIQIIETHRTQEHPDCPRFHLETILDRIEKVAESSEQFETIRRKDISNGSSMSNL